VCSVYLLLLLLLLKLLLLLLLLLLERIAVSSEEYVDLIDGSLSRGELRVPAAFALSQPGDLVGTVSLFVSKDNHADGLLLIMASLPGVSLEARWAQRRFVVGLVYHVPVEG